MKNYNFCAKNQDIINPFSIFDIFFDTKFDEKLKNIGDGKYTLNVPGYDKNDLDIYFKDNKLFIKSKCKEDECNSELDIYFYVNKNVDRNKTEATVEKGVLTLKLFEKDKNENIQRIELK